MALNFYEIPNIRPVPTNLRREEITHNYPQLASLKRQAYSTCREQIGEFYIQSVFRKFSGGYAYYDDMFLLGFVLWDAPPPKGITQSDKLHLLLICATPTDFQLGAHMLDDVEGYCIINEYSFIELTPANDKLRTYYEKFGYKKVQHENYHVNTMIKIIAPVRIQKPKNGKTRKQKRNRTKNTTNVLSPNVLLNSLLL
jgi:hypothetical protein